MITAEYNDTTPLTDARRDAAFAELAPRVEAMLAKPQRLLTLKVWAARDKLAPTQVEETVYWLELQGRVRSFKAFDGYKRFVVAGAAVDDDSGQQEGKVGKETAPPSRSRSHQEAATPDTDASPGPSATSQSRSAPGPAIPARTPPAAPNHRPAPIRAPKESTMANASDWMSSLEAAKRLGVGTSAVSKLYNDGKLVGRKTGNGIRAPLELKRSSVEQLAAVRNGAAPAERPQGAAKTKSPPPARAERKPARKPTAALRRELSGGVRVDLEEAVRALLKVYDLGVLDAEATLMHVESLVSV
jgi:hypothetical protein